MVESMEKIVRYLESSVSAYNASIKDGSACIDFLCDAMKEREILNQKIKEQLINALSEKWKTSALDFYKSYLNNLFYEGYAIRSLKKVPTLTLYKYTRTLGILEVEQRIGENIAQEKRFYLHSRWLYDNMLRMLLHNNPGSNMHFIEMSVDRINDGFSADNISLNKLSKQINIVMLEFFGQYLNLITQQEFNSQDVKYLLANIINKNQQVEQKNKLIFIDEKTFYNHLMEVVRIRMLGEKYDTAILHHK